MLKLGNVTAGASTTVIGIGGGIYAYDQISQAIPGLTGQILGGIVCIGLIAAGLFLPNFGIHAVERPPQG